MSYADDEYPDSPMATDPEGLSRPGVAYVDDSALALQRVRIELFNRGVLLETYTSLDALFARPDRPLVGVLLDVDLGPSDDAIGALECVRAKYGPVKVAFVTANASDARRAHLSPHGLVFDKLHELHAAIDWLAGFASRRSNGHTHCR